MNEPKNIIIQIQDSYLAELIYHWIQDGKPCSLLFQKPKCEELTAIRLVMDSNESASFILHAFHATGCKVYVKTKNGVAQIDLSRYRLI